MERRSQTGHEVADELFLARKSSIKKNDIEIYYANTSGPEKPFFSLKKRNPWERKESFRLGNSNLGGGTTII